MRRFCINSSEPKTYLPMKAEAVSHVDPFMYSIINPPFDELFLHRLYDDFKLYEYQFNFNLINLSSKSEYKICWHNEENTSSYHLGRNGFICRCIYNIWNYTEIEPQFILISQNDTSIFNIPIISLLSHCKIDILYILDLKTTPLWNPGRNTTHNADERYEMARCYGTITMEKTWTQCHSSRRSWIWFSSKMVKNKQQTN